jgi:hypothetical protein
MHSYAGLMTETERLAHRHLSTVYKFSGGRTDAAAVEAVREKGGLRRRWLSDDPHVLELAAGGLAALEARVAARILKERSDDIFLNYCPKCGGLTRTPKARLCLHCGYSWHHVAAG